ncbi:hypothetical protein O181_019126 [Austropuccinia psidii MF-1]|uniref:Uncharacterized protein n=1 Tax=Austropuccinia psidii MF-1 TaxID=1389203 RepID=A0A9Q3GTJ8_9BASI|nr:hypothetical protein [Austropuccinia psidii MF-1]
MEEYYAFPYENIKQFDGKLVHLWQNWLEKPQERSFKIQKRDNTIINLTQKTQDLSISPRSDKFVQEFQNKKWPNNLRRQLEDSTSEDESPSIIYKPINKTEEKFQILVDGNENINGNPFKNELKMEKFRFSEHHELSDEEIIIEREK